METRRHLKFHVTARTAKLIGMENFANAEGAVIELVKNAYDADSSVCYVVFDIQSTPKESAIYIIDKGFGMTDDVITNQWMTIGTDDKLQHAQSSRTGRVKSGAKGIGRFALNRLGAETEMLTFPDDRLFGYRWMLDWRAFDQPGKKLSDIDAILEEIDNEDFLTRCRHFGLDRIEPLFNDLCSTPFKGTLIRISNLNDEWEEDSISNLFGTLEMLIPEHLTADFQLFLYTMSDTEMYGSVPTGGFDDYDYKVSAHYTGGESNVLQISIERNELNLSLLETRYAGVFEQPAMKAFPFRLEDFKKGKFTKEVSMDGFWDKDRLNDVGEFIFTFFFLKNTVNDDSDSLSSRKYPYNGFDSASRKRWLKKFGGVKIYRDNFRVRPYGEPGNDWLRLGERQSQSPGGPGQKMGGYRIRPNQIAGSVYISRLSNLFFNDKSSREGMQENEEFGLLKSLLIRVISEFENDRNTIMFSLSQWDRQNNPSEAKARDLSRHIAEERKRKDESGSQSKKTDEEILAEGYLNMENLLSEKDNELMLLRGLASTGIVVTSFTHELKSLSGRLMPRTGSLETILHNYIKPEELNGIDRFDNPYYHIELIRQEDQKLQQWLQYSLNTIRRDKRERKIVSFHVYFESFGQLWRESLKRKSIHLVIGDVPKELSVKAFEMDLDSIFNNFIANSVYSLLRTDVTDKEIHVSVYRDHDYVAIDFVDNGKGLDKEYQDNPSVIFNALETSTKDKYGNKIGTGMGLYIAKSVVGSYKDASIGLIPVTEGFGIKVLFKLD